MKHRARLLEKLLQFRPNKAGSTTDICDCTLEKECPVHPGKFCTNVEDEDSDVTGTCKPCGTAFEKHLQDWADQRKADLEKKAGKKLSWSQAKALDQAELDKEMDKLFPKGPRRLTDPEFKRIK